MYVSSSVEGSNQYANGFYAVKSIARPLIGQEKKWGANQRGPPP